MPNASSAMVMLLILLDSVRVEQISFNKVPVNVYPPNDPPLYSLYNFETAKMVDPPHISSIYLSLRCSKG